MAEIPATLDIPADKILAAVQAEVAEMIAPLAQQLLDLQGRLDALEAQHGVINDATSELRIALQEWASKA